MITRENSTLPMETSEIKYSDLKYNSLLIGLSNEKAAEVKNSVESKKSFLQETFNEQTKADLPTTIINLERNNTVYIFNSPKLIHSLSLTSDHIGDMYAIHSSGRSSRVKPRTINEKEERSKNQNFYLIEYHPEAICIGFAIHKDSKISKSLVIDVSESAKNSSKMLDSIRELKNEIHTQQTEINENEIILNNQKIKIEEMERFVSEIEEREGTLGKLIIEKDKLVRNLEIKKETLIKENTEIDFKNTSMKNNLESSIKKVDDLSVLLTEKENEKLTLSADVEKLYKDIEKLKIDKNQFDNELTGYSNEGAKQSKAYYAISLSLITIITLLTIYITSNGVDLIYQTNTNNNSNVLNIILSRLPLTIGISITLSFSFTLVYVMIKNIIKINSDRMRFLQASIIAKDIYLSTEGVEGLNIYEREKMRQEAKIKIISKIFENEQITNANTKIIEAIIEKVMKSS